MSELRTQFKFKAIPRILVRKFGKLFRIKRSPKSKGYHKFLSESEQRQVIYSHLGFIVFTEQIYLIITAYLEFFDCLQNYASILPTKKH